VSDHSQGLRSLACTAATAALISGAAAAQDGAAPAPDRYAIVVGNSDYTTAPDLKNARADARLFGDFLAGQGYRVSRYDDLSKLGFERMLRRVLFDVDKDSEVVFYYAGHGLQIAGGNYLIPVDADLDDAYDVPFEAISLSSVVSIIGARARLQMVILDSCRDNPFGNTRVVADLSSGLSETRDGFNVLTAPINSLLSFSTSPGTVAFDGSGANSPFTEALVETAAAAPERPVGQVFEDVRRLVFERTEGRQVPWESSTLVQPASFAIPEAGPDLAQLATDPGEGQARSLVLLAAGQGAVAEAVEGAGEGIALAGPLEHEVAIGPALAAEMPVAPEAQLEIVEPPANGRLVLRQPDGRLEDAARQGLTGADLDRLVYISERDNASAALAPVPAAAETFRLASGGETEAVQLNLEADPCDREAGDHLDPEGVGLARYPNEIAPEAAQAACAAAVAKAPDTGRFHYQLGRADLALRDFDGARAEFERARDLGHTRAWYALGALEANAAATIAGDIDAPAPEEALALYREGVGRGDPYAYHALGKQLLRYGQTEAERREGFELLSRALELGHTFAMNELGTYFLDPDSPDADPARGLRYLQESADRGDIYGYNNLGFVYLNGLGGVAADPQAAFEWFRKAADGGHPQAPGNLGRLWNSGALGEDGRTARAVEWYDMGLERGDGWSGANAAWIIANEGVPGLSLRDAGVRAAKAAVLRGADSAAEARSLLDGLPPEAVDGASQMLLNALGASVTVDGDFGASSVAEMERLLAAHGVAAPSGDPADRALALAEAYWRSTKFRVDLY
jgi:uncharacterized caspase-like protein/TPR repeat protein